MKELTTRIGINGATAPRRPRRLGAAGIIGLVALVALVALVVVVGLAGTALANWEARVVARDTEMEHFAARPIQARVGEVVELGVVLVDPSGDVLFGDGADNEDDQRVRLRRRAERVDGPLPEGVAIRWLRVVPRLEHLELEPPNPGIETFSNNVLFGPDHGEWLGYDTLEYDTWTLRQPNGLPATGSRLTVDRAEPSWGRRGTAGAGSNWFAVEVELPDGTVIRSADGDDLDRYGLVRDVQRVSYRTGDHFVDWLATYINVPHLFGSTGPSDSRHQTEVYVGADCADAMVGAWRAAGNDEVEYSSVSGIDEDADPVTDVLFIEPTGEVRDEAGAIVDLRWGEDVQRGDLIAIDFTRAGDWLPRRWDHIGALASDSSPLGSPDGRFDGYDIMRHMSRRGLVDVALWRMRGIKVRLWRWDD